MLLTTLTGCTTITVTPLDPSYKVSKICIYENTAVTIDDMLPVIIDNLERHNIESILISTNSSDFNAGLDTLVAGGSSATKYSVLIDCNHYLNYTAEQWWDFSTYLSSADIVISDKKTTIAYAKYDLYNKGGLSLMKWQGTKSKLNPVLDELLKFY